MSYCRQYRYVVLLLSVSLALIGCGKQRVTMLTEEPQVTVLIDAETDEKKSMPIEEYVKGVVGGEMGRLPARGGEEHDWPENAYAAQAILARTFAMEHLTSAGEISTDVEQAQAYRPENVTAIIAKAVDKTRGQVLMDGDAYVTTWFHSYSGGRTATAAEGLNYTEEETHTQSVELPVNNYVPEERQRWSATFSLAEITQALAAKGVAVDEVSDVRVNKRGPSGRVTEFAVSGKTGTVHVPGVDFRLAVGAEKMLSTLIDMNGVAVQDQQVTFNGAGFGHGVGMSQWDAYKMAKEGASPRAIVLRFFTNVQLQKRWR